ncbi:MAG: hypothetical protein HC802_06580 [Caldilineaceae bacterium]|nr:hypothetical protein [Caldilineaceae bacterium]
MLKIADKMVAGVILPGVLLVLLIAIPYLDPNPSRRGSDRKVAIISGIVAGVVMIILSWMGTPQYAVLGAPAVEVVQELMPEEGAGLVREIGYRHLPVGVYDTRLSVEEQTTDEEFAEILHEYQASIHHWQELDPDFNEAYGILEITENQPALRQLHWNISWLNSEGTNDNFQRNFWLHRDSLYWEQYGRRDFGFLRAEQEAE